MSRSGRGPRFKRADTTDALPKRRSQGAKNADEVVGLAGVSVETIYPHVFQNANREVGGVLVGRMPADGTSPMVTGAIPAISADERRATLTFTQDSWAHVHQTLGPSFRPTNRSLVGTTAIPDLASSSRDTTSSSRKTSSTRPPRSQSSLTPWRERREPSSGETASSLRSRSTQRQTAGPPRRT